MKSLSRICVCIMLLCGSMMATAQDVVFTENWNDGLGADRWSAPIYALENPNNGPDGNVDYAFNYGVEGFGVAPNTTDGTQIGVFMQTNLTEGDGNQGETVGIIPLNFTLPALTDYEFQTDMFLYWNGGGGSTEYGIVGVHHQGSDQVPSRFSDGAPLDGDGIAWAVDSDGDSGTNDLMRFVAPGEGQSEVNTWEGIPSGTIPNIDANVPDFEFIPSGDDPAPIGPWSIWTTLKIKRAGRNVEWSINDVVIDTYEDTERDFDGGTILLAEMDPFNSVNLEIAGIANGVIFDNVKVTTFEPDAVVGDMNGDGEVNFGDLSPFALGLTNIPGYEEAFPELADTRVVRGDVSGDTAFNFGDLSPFVDLLTLGGAAGSNTAVPEPTSWLLFMGASCLATCGSRRRCR